MVHKIHESLLPFMVEVGWLKLADLNPKNHNDSDLKELARSLDEFGQRKPIVYNINTWEIEAGNGTFIAAKDYLGWTHIAGIGVDDTNDKALSYAIADNRTSELSSWNTDHLRIIFKSIKKESVPGVDGDFLINTRLEIPPVVAQPVPSMIDFNFETPPSEPKNTSSIIIEVVKEDYREVKDFITETLENSGFTFSIR